MYKYLRHQSGQLLIELLVAMGLFVIITPALLTGFVASREGRAQQSQRLEATALLREAEEALRVIREADWVNVATNGVYHPEVSGSSWSLVAGSELVNDFTRQLIIADVFRGIGGEIVSSGGTLDPSTKEVTAVVSWTSPLATSVQSTLYFTRYLENMAFIHTTDTDFNLSGSQLSDTVVVNNNGGEVRLAPLGPGRGDWCVPNQMGELNLPGQGAARTITAIPGEAFVGTGGNASGKDLTYVTIDNSYPPNAIIGGEFDNNYKSNAVFGEPGFAYIATDFNSREVVIISTGNMTEIGHFDAPSPLDADTVFVSGNTGYTITGSILYSFDLSSKVGERPELDSISLSSDGAAVFVVGSYAYVATEGTSDQLVILNVSNPSSIFQEGSVSVAGQEGRDVYVSDDGARAYLVTGEDAGQAEFFIINIESKSSPSVISSYETNGMDPQGVEMVLVGYRALLAGTGGEEYQVVDLSNESAPVRCGGINDDTGVYDVAEVIEADGDVYAYLSTGQASSEFKIIEGGPGNNFKLSGTYESAVFDASDEVAFNHAEITVDEPTDTDIQYQLGIADAPGGDCSAASFTFVGPDLLETSFFESSNFVPFDNDNLDFENPSRCFKYKFYLSTNIISKTPQLFDITINYSP